MASKGVNYTFEKLHYLLHFDPIYGPKAGLIESIIEKFYKVNEGNVECECFRREYMHNPLQNDHQCHLIYIWIKYYDLPVYVNGKEVSIQESDFYEYEYLNVEINLKELKDCLLKHSFQLPKAIFVAKKALILKKFIDCLRKYFFQLPRAILVSKKVLTPDELKLTSEIDSSDFDTSDEDVVVQNCGENKLDPSILDCLYIIGLLLEIILKGISSEKIKLGPIHRLKQAGLAKEISILYTGNHGLSKRNIDKYFSFANKTRQLGIAVVGEGENKANLCKLTLSSCLKIIGALNEIILMGVPSKLLMGGRIGPISEEIDVARLATDLTYCNKGAIQITAEKMVSYFSSAQKEISEEF